MEPAPVVIQVSVIGYAFVKDARSKEYVVRHTWERLDLPGGAPLGAPDPVDVGPGVHHRHPAGRNRVADFQALRELCRAERRGAPPSACAGPGSNAHRGSLRSREKIRRRVVEAPPCPPTRVFGGRSPEFLEQRRGALERWIQQVRGRTRDAGGAPGK